ncbi:MAG TPA: tRNA-dihydrouridine synthase, partial [Leptolinea sp.]
GRGAIGNPWIFSRKNRSECSGREIFETLRNHLNASLQYYGPKRGLILFRKYTGEYINREWPSVTVRQDVLTTMDQNIFLEKIQQILEK